MPRFFFDFFDGQTWSADEHGLDLASAEEAYLEAFAGARSMWPELTDGHRDPSGCAFEIRVADGESVFRFDFIELLGNHERAASPDVPNAAIVRSLHATQRKALAARAELRASLDQVCRSIDESRILLSRLAQLERESVPQRAGATGGRTAQAA